MNFILLNKLLANNALLFSVRGVYSPKNTPRLPVSPAPLAYERLRTSFEARPLPDSVRIPTCFGP
jgi:hypothetical protein